MARRAVSDGEQGPPGSAENRGSRDGRRNTYWKGWPTAANPVAPPDFSIRVLRVLRPAR